MFAVTDKFMANVTTRAVMVLYLWTSWCWSNSFFQPKDPTNCKSRQSSILPAETPSFAVSSNQAGRVGRKELAEELNLPDYTNNPTSQDLNCILTRCLALDRRGENLHTFHTVEFESDCIQELCVLGGSGCYPFVTAQQRVHGVNFQKVYPLCLRYHCPI